MPNEKIYQMDFAKTYQLLINKAVRKGRTKQEVAEVTCWLTGYTLEELLDMQQKHLTYAQFFENAPKLAENTPLIKGSVCGVRVEEVKEPLMRAIRCLDKLVDELAKGKAMEKILHR